MKNSITCPREVGMADQLSIAVTSGVGRGQTKLAAFDAALWDAGIANLNLIKLSSIIPTGAVVEAKKPSFIEGDFGKKLYVVLSENRESEKGREAWAGLGWVQAESGQGLFVEQEGSHENEVVRLIKETLSDMVKYRGGNFGKIRHRIIGIRCDDEPVCAVVAASYQLEQWVIVRRAVGAADIHGTEKTVLTHERVALEAT